MADLINRARDLVARHGWSLALLAVLVVDSVLVYAGAGWWHAQIQAAEARGRTQAMAYRAPEPVAVPQVVCPEPVRPIPTKRQPAARPAAPAPGVVQVVPAPRPQTDLDRRLAAFQAEIDATPNPMKELSR